MLRVCCGAGIRCKLKTFIEYHEYDSGSDPTTKVLGLIGCSHGTLSQTLTTVIVTKNFDHTEHQYYEKMRYGVKSGAQEAHEVALSF